MMQEIPGWQALIVSCIPTEGSGLREGALDPAGHHVSLHGALSLLTKWAVLQVPGYLSYLQMRGTELSKFQHFLFRLFAPGS